jgi:putative spermidine/putrescine transport system ATP-binding protein
VRFRDSAISLDTFNSPNAPPPKQGDKVVVSFAPEDVLVLDGAPA